jgi:hypothetical protein
MADGAEGEAGEHGRTAAGDKSEGHGQAVAAGKSEEPSRRLAELATLRELAEERLDFNEVVLRPFLLCAYIVLPTATATIFSYFNVETVDVEARIPHRVLKSDYSVAYAAREHQQHLPFAIVSAMAYSLLLPVSLMAALRSRWRSGASPVRLLGEGYRPEFKWWEALEAFRQVVLVGGVIIVRLLVLELAAGVDAGHRASSYASVAQLLFAILVQVVFVVVLARVAPLDSAANNLVMLLAQTAMLLVLQAALTLHFTAQLQAIEPEAELVALNASGTEGGTEVALGGVGVFAAPAWTGLRLSVYDAVLGFFMICILLAVLLTTCIVVPIESYRERRLPVLRDLTNRTLVRASELDFGEEYHVFLSHVYAQPAASASRTARSQSISRSVPREHNPQPAQAALSAQRKPDSSARAAWLRQHSPRVATQPGRSSLSSDSLPRTRPPHPFSNRLRHTLYSCVRNAPRPPPLPLPTNPPLPPPSLCALFSCAIAGRAGRTRPRL